MNNPSTGKLTKGFLVRDTINTEALPLDGDLFRYCEEPLRPWKSMGGSSSIQTCYHYGDNHDDYRKDFIITHRHHLLLYLSTNREATPPDIRLRNSRGQPSNHHWQCHYNYDTSSQKQGISKTGFFVLFCGLMATHILYSVHIGARDTPALSRLDSSRS